MYFNSNILYVNTHTYTERESGREKVRQNLPVFLSKDFKQSTYILLFNEMHRTHT